MPRSTRVFKKRRREFCKKKVSEDCEISDSDVVLEEPVGDRLGLDESDITPRPRPTVDTDDVVSASKLKLGNISKNYNDIIDKEPDFVNEIVNMNNLMKVISQIAVCKNCYEPIDFKIKNRVGLFFSGNFSCAGCSEKTLASFENSSIIIPNKPQDKKVGLYDINVRLVYGMRTIGKGQTAAATLCGVLNLPTPPSQFSNYTEVLGSEAENVLFQNYEGSSRGSCDIE